jgi:hypothetical protein
LNSPTFLGRKLLDDNFFDRAAARRADAARSGSSFVKSPERRRRRHRDRSPRRYGLLRVARPGQPRESTALFSDLIETFPRWMVGSVDCKAAVRERDPPKTT